MPKRKNSINVHVEKNALKDEGDGVISFQGGQVIVDDSVMWSGYKYDIETLDVSQYKGQVTVDHWDTLDTLVARVPAGAYKSGNRVLIDQIDYAVNQNPTARLAYDMMRAGYLTDFSVETIGPWPGEDDKTYHEHALVGLSVVVAGNNKNAHMSREASLVVQNSIAASREDGLDVTEIEQAVKPLLHVEDQKPEPKKPEAEDLEKKENHKQEPQEMSYKTIKNTRDFPVTVHYKNAAGEDVETEIVVGSSIDVAEDQAVAVEAQVNAAQKPQEDVSELIANAMKEAEEKHAKELEAVEKKMNDMFNTNVEEPKFTRSGKVTSSAPGAGQKLADMDWRDRTALQLRSLNAAIKSHDRDAGQTLNEINRINLESLQKEGIVANSLDLPDVGNFVIPTEMVKEIKEQASNYTPILNAFNFQETLSLETAWLKGTGEIEMEDVDMDDNGDDADLKPVKKPTFSTDTTRLYEFAAVTPVKSSALRFAAVDLVSHLTRLYRRAYDRRLAQSVIGRLEKAVQANGNSVNYDYSSAAGGDVEALITLITAWSEIAEHTPNGTFLMTEASRLHLTAMALRAGVSGPLASLFTEGPDGIPRFLSRPYVVVPSDLMPSLNTADTKSWSFEDTSVTVSHGVLLADPTDFVGKVSGGLNFQVSDVASYEESNTTKSAFQRDELVFRGYGYRASGLYFEDSVAGVSAPGIS
ncbi:phage major capsid protein [Mycolicibacterium moriokaense]|nr:phage major capsid protein [Mycolicibacterium moriokaense]